MISTPRDSGEGQGDTIVVIDHKAFPRELEATVGRSDEVAVQLAGYQAAFNAGVWRVVAVQHNPLFGQIAELLRFQPHQRRERQ